MPAAPLSPPVAKITPEVMNLSGPGPSMVGPETYRAMLQPVLGVRDPAFLQIIHEIQAGLRVVLGTSNPATYPLPGGGSAAMEAAVANFCLPGSKLGVFAAGYFADRLSEMASRYGINVVRCERPWGEAFSEEDAENFMSRERPDAVAFVQAETSTGVYQSGANIVPAARRYGALVLADVVTSMGAMPVELDAVGIDVAYGCSQKGLSCPAGLAPLSVAPHAMERLAHRPGRIPSWFLDLRLLAGYYEPPHIYHHTPSPPLFYALQQSLRGILSEGLPERWNRHRSVGERLIKGLESMDFKPFVSNPQDRIWHVAAAIPPPGIDEVQLRNRLALEQRTEIGAGLGQLAGKIVRVGAMGPLATEDRVDRLLEAIRASL